MAAITSNAVGSLGTPALWSATSTWVGSVVPVDGDSVTIVPTAVIYPDITMSAWTTGLVGLAINGTLRTPVGITVSPYIKMGADITGTGDWENYMYLNPNYAFDVDFNGTAYGFNSSGLTLDFRSNEPTNRYCLLSAAEAIGQTILSVDTDVSSDWAVGDTVCICDIDKGKDVETTTIASMTTTTITVDDSLVGAKLEGAYILLMTRNIKITGTTSVPFRSIEDSTIKAEIDTTYRGMYNGGNCVLGGTWRGMDRLSYNCDKSTFEGVACDCNYVLYSSDTDQWIKLKDGIVAGCTTVFYSGRGYVDSGKVIGCNYFTFGNATIQADNCDIVGCQYALYLVLGTFQGSINSCADAITLARNLIATFVGSGNTRIIDRSQNIQLSNTEFSGIENGSYNNDTYQFSNNYTSSKNHGNVADAFKSWTFGGIVEDDTTAPLATDFSQHFRHTCEDASNWCFRQEEITIAAGETLSVTGYMRASADASQKIEIIDKFADPLVDSGNSALDTDTPTHSTSWVAVSVEYENTGAIPRSVYIRTSAKHATATMDEVWTIASSSGGIAGISRGRLLGGL